MLPWLPAVTLPLPFVAVCYLFVQLSYPVPHVYDDAIGAIGSIWIPLRSSSNLSWKTSLTLAIAISIFDFAHVNWTFLRLTLAKSLPRSKILVPPQQQKFVYSRDMLRLLITQQGSSPTKPVSFMVLLLSSHTFISICSDLHDFTARYCQSMAGSGFDMFLSKTGSSPSTVDSGQPPSVPLNLPSFQLSHLFWEPLSPISEGAWQTSCLMRKFWKLHRAVW